MEMNKIKKVENNLKEILKHWGFGETCSSIYAVLSLSSEPLTAQEIAKRIEYAYTTTINALNHSIDLGHIKKMRVGRKNVYYLDSDLADIIKEKLEYFLNILEETEKAMYELEEKERKRLSGAIETINNAITFLKRMKKVEARA